MENTESSVIKWVCVAIIIGAVLVAAAIIYNKNYQNPAALNQARSQTVDIANVKTDGAAFRGDVNAPFTVAYWSDYQCPFCKRNEAESMSQLIKDYVDTGKVKLVYKDFVFLGDDSDVAGLAAKAVWEVAPDKFPAWHDAMYQKQDDENAGWGNRADILALTQSLGIDSVKVGELMDSKKDAYQAALDADKAEAGSFGITGTPSFIIGKQFIEGAQPYDTVIKPAIEAMINGK